jgi:endonuclease YncB( thermonuclease family)
MRIYDKPHFIKYGIAALLAATCVAAWAETLTGRVVGVADGDTITVLDASNGQHKIRLAGIDAPEKNQPYGQVAKQSLSDQVFDRQVSVETSKRDRYGREIGKVLVDGRDANLEQLRRGLAWHYKAYEREQEPLDRATYSGVEIEARGASRGLWSDPVPVAPWDWRHNKAAR